MPYSHSKKILCEALGTCFLLATVVGSGIMAQNLSGGNVAIALLCNTIATGAILYVLITAFGPISGAHFNPVVSFVFYLKRDIGVKILLSYILVQVLGALLGVFLAHAMFGVDIVQFSHKIRTGHDIWISEAVATFGLVLVIMLTVKTNAGAVAQSVALYITAAYWFTASTSFANPAVTLARAFSDSFAGIRPLDVPAFIVVQFLGAFAAFHLVRFLTMGDGD